MAGIDVDTIPMSSLYPIVYSMIVDESYSVGSGETRLEGRQRVDEWLDEQRVAWSGGATHAEETWGLLPEHQSGLEAALAMAGVVHANNGDAPAQTGGLSVGETGV